MSSPVLDYRSPTDQRVSRLRKPITHWLPWAIYLGMSWTWCIGMFLPVLLVRDYGVWGWVVFAVPNVVGAAAMGWVLKDGTSEKIVANHGRAISVFSFVTATFQLFFAFWMAWAFAGPGFAGMVLLCAMTAVACGVRGDRQTMWLAVTVLIVSVWCLLISASFGVVRLPRTVYPFAYSPHSSASSLWGLSASCLLGFVCCPYLDSTFYLVRQRLPQPKSRASFSIGFGVFFLAMIVSALSYSRAILQMMESSVVRTGMAWVFVFWIAQLGFTVGIHWRNDVSKSLRTRRDPLWMRITLSIVVAGIIILALAGSGRDLVRAGEQTYRSLLGFYGLVFPAYVWLCMLPGKGRVAPAKHQWIVTGITILIASPMYFLGFIQNKMMWLLPGVAVVLLARLFIRAVPQALPPQPLTADSGTTSTT